MLNLSFGAYSFNSSFNCDLSSLTSVISTLSASLVRIFISPTGIFRINFPLLCWYADVSLENEKKFYIIKYVFNEKKVPILKNYRYSSLNNWIFLTWKWFIKTGKQNLDRKFPSLDNRASRDLTVYFTVFI